MTVELGASTRVRAAGTWLTTVMAAGLLASCGNSSSSSQSPASAPASTSAAAASTSATTDTTSAAAASTNSGSEAAPGATFQPGQAEVVRYQQIGNSGNYGPADKLKLTIESITPGSMSDFKNVSLSGVPKGSTPTYVKVSMTNLGPQTLKTSSSTPAYDLQGVVGNQLDDSLSIGGFFAPCPDADTPNPFPVGKTFDTCLTFLVPGGVTKIAYNGADEYVNSPVFWSAS